MDSDAAIPEITEKITGQDAVPPLSTHTYLVPWQTTLVGRDAELTQLGRLLTGDSERAVVVCGEPGVGKSALTDQVSARAAAEGWRVVRVQGVHAEELFALGEGAVGKTALISR